MLESDPGLGVSGRQGELSPLDTETGMFMLAFCEERRTGPLTSSRSWKTTLAASLKPRGCSGAPKTATSSSVPEGSASWPRLITACFADPSSC
eukprot:2524406-Pyramimonas_sp.AAC.1